MSLLIRKKVVKMTLKNNNNNFIKQQSCITELNRLRVYQMMLKTVLFTIDFVFAVV